MRAIGQITIKNICDVVASETAPENPYVGQLWVDTSVAPPETKIWNGAEWVVQNDIETIRTTISILTTRSAELQSTIDGLNSYVGTMTETLETVTDNLGNEHQTVLEMQAQMSQLQQTIDGLTIQVTNQYAGGLNFIQNEQRFSRNDLFPANDAAEFVQNSGNLKVMVKNRSEGIIRLKVKIGNIFKLLFPKALQGVCFTALTHPGQQQRFPVRTIFPFYQLRHDGSFHIRVPPPRRLHDLFQGLQT